jgi:hypothetical protein
MNDVLDVLRFLDFHEVKPAGADWMPTSEVGADLGTTDDTHIIHHKHEPTARLVDPETGMTVGMARRSCVLHPPEEATTVMA